MKKSEIRKEIRKAVEQAVKEELRSSRKTTVDKITDKLRWFVSPDEPLDMDDKASDVVVGGGNVLEAFADDLNERGPYRHDIIFKTNAFSKAKIVWDLIDVIRKTYRKAGWKVTSS